MQQQGLWTRNFTILILGTVISATGGVGINFALSVLVYNETASTFLSALFVTLGMVPHVLLPPLVGPWLDRIARRKIIVWGDFIMSALFLIVSAIAWNGSFNYAFYLSVSLIAGSIGVVYRIAYDSLFPELIAPGYTQKGYAIASIIYPTISTLMFPVAALIFENFGVRYLFLAQGILLMVAALFETRIHLEEQAQRLQQQIQQSFKTMFIEGLAYLRDEAGIRAIFVYFFFLTLAGQAIDVLFYPFFENHPVYSLTQYALAISFVTAGRMIGGIAHYLFKIPHQQRFAIAAFVYFSLSFLQGSLMLLNLSLILAVQLVIGMLTINSYNIRMSAVQTYVPADKRARLNGLFHLLTTFGVMLGRLIAGSLGEVFPYASIVLSANAFALVAFYLLIYRRREAIKPIYNQVL
jgi:DHA3 family macrolide efflux protein-like MFS transporter